MRKPNLGQLSVCISLFFLAGCGGDHARPVKTEKVTGVVTVGGNPIQGAIVGFHSEKVRVATGTTDAKGKFRLTTYQTGDGAVPGTHKVSITYSLDPEAVVSNDPESLAKAVEAKNRIPAKYNNPETSGLSKEVKAGENNHFEFEL